ncbi:MAG: glycosyltransferase family 39 protein [Chloroflexi bacterium]|nr:glycosyltransferase family 39 protein [Chloroflexota bacterium]
MRIETGYQKWAKDFLWRYRWLLAIIAVGLFLRVGMAMYLAGRDFVSDESEYFGAALSLAQGRGFSFFDSGPWLRPPVYIVFLAIPIKLWGPQVTPILAIQHGISVLTIVLFYLIGKELFNRRVGLFTAAACAVYLPFAIFPNLVLTETLFLAFFAAGVLLLLKSRSANRRYLLVGAAGALMSMATLTKGSLIAFVPFVAIWLFFSTSGRRQRLAAAGVFLAMFVVLLLPWTARNFLAYHAFIPVETTGAVNLWLASHQGPSSDIYSALSQATSIPERQSLAYSGALHDILSDPLGWIGRGTEGLAGLWRINFSGDERFVHGFSHGLVSGPYLIALFLMDDSLYVVLMCLALVGLATAKHDASQALVLLWVGVSCLLAVVFFAIARFRIPVLPFLFPYAGYAVMSLAPQLRSAIPSRTRIAAAGALCAVFLFTVLPTYPIGFTSLGFEAWLSQSHLTAGDLLLDQGELDQAQTEFEKADRTIPETSVELARVEILKGNPQEAEKLLQDGKQYFGTKVLLGDIYRNSGEMDPARRLFTDSIVNEQNPTSWAWEKISPPPSSRIDVGDGLDLGYVRGMQLGEQDGTTTFRWTSGDSFVRFPGAPAATGYRLTLRMRGWRPEGLPAPVADILANGKPVASIVASGGWAVYSIELPAGTMSPSQNLVVEIKSDIFTPGFSDPRLLGVMLDWVSLEPTG